MFDIQIQAENHLDQLLSKVHRTLSQSVVIVQDSRELLPIEESIMSHFDENSFMYQSLVKILAIDSYTNSVAIDSKKFNDLLGSLSLLFQLMSKLGQGLKQNIDKKNLVQIYKSSYEAILDCIQICEERENSGVVHKKQRSQGDEASNLRQQNIQLKKKLAANDQQLVSMELKLTHLLKEHSHSDHNPLQSAHSSANILQLRQELSFKQSEIQRMNEEFSYEIQKYNTVYEAMKKELQEMRSYQNIDLIEQIEMLETEIVRLREENERDQMIIRQLRADIAMTASSFESPRHNQRQYSRYNY